MTITLFMTLFTMGSLISSLMTESLKKAFTGIPANLIALIDSILVGGIGTVSYYLVMGLDFNTVNVVCILFMIICIWMGSMLGYDKIKQLISQLTFK